MNMLRLPFARGEKMFFDLAILLEDEALARKPQQKRSTAKQRAIFEAAAQVFAARGYQGANTKEIAQRAGVSIGTLYFNFVDKRQILLTMLAEQVSRSATMEPVDKVALANDPCGYLQAELAQAFPYDLGYYSIAGAVRELTVIDESFRNRFGVLMEAIYHRIQEIIELAEQAGLTRTDLDKDGTARTLTNLVINFYALLPHPAGVSAEMYWQRHRLATQIICRAMFRDECCYFPSFKEPIDL